MLSKSTSRSTMTTLIANIILILSIMTVSYHSFLLCMKVIYVYIKVSYHSKRALPVREAINEYNTATCWYYK